MNDLLIEILQQQIAALGEQLSGVETRAAQLRLTLDALQAHLKQAQADAVADAARAEQEKAEAARLEQMRVEQARAEAERAEEQRAAEAERAEQARLAAAAAERERVAAAERARVEAEHAEQARIEAERKEAEAERARQQAATASNEPAAHADTKAPVAEQKGTLAPPVANIREAISIGDRFLFQRELFAQDGELMNRTIERLNSLPSLQEAMAYIEHKFEWDKESQAYELFVNILKRRWN